MITIVDYQMGNIGSVRNMLRRIGAPAIISSKPEDIARATKLILPGVGAFDTGMANIDALGLRPLLHEKVLKERVPVLGICLGMQLLMEGSEEGANVGLGWIRGSSVKFRFGADYPGMKTPHMGWNTVAPAREHALYANLDPDHGFYFVHSYHVVCEEPTDVLATTTHGYAFAASVQRDNILGTQFHPEKSHRHGMRLLKNFVDL